MNRVALAALSLVIASASASAAQVTYDCGGDLPHTFVFDGNGISILEVGQDDSWIMTGRRKADYKPRVADKGSQLYVGFEENGADCSLSVWIDAKLAARAKVGQAQLRCRGETYDTYDLTCTRR